MGVVHGWGSRWGGNAAIPRVGDTKDPMHFLQILMLRLELKLLGPLSYLSQVMASCCLCGC